jgi:hypothetical protein
VTPKLNGIIEPRFSVACAVGSSNEHLTRPFTTAATGINLMRDSHNSSASRMISRQSIRKDGNINGGYSSQTAHPKTSFAVYRKKKDKNQLLFDTNQSENHLLI